jgi:hypothetical protein
MQFLYTWKVKLCRDIALYIRLHLQRLECEASVIHALSMHDADILNAYVLYGKPQGKVILFGVGAGVSRIII